MGGASGGNLPAAITESEKTGEQGQRREDGSGDDGSDEKVERCVGQKVEKEKKIQTG